MINGDLLVFQKLTQPPEALLCDIKRVERSTVEQGAKEIGYGGGKAC